VLLDAKSLESKLAEANEARKEIGLPLLSVKVRKCLQCGDPFASVEARVCTPCHKKRDSE
jgi:hypothetical protein